MPGKWFSRVQHQSSRSQVDQLEKEGATVSAAKDTAGLAEGVKADPPIHAERSGANVHQPGRLCQP